MFVNTTHDKMSEVLYKPRRHPDRHLAVFSQIAASPLFLHHHRRRLSLPRVSLTRGSSPTRRPSPTCRSSPTRRSSRHTRSAVSRRRRARSRRRPPSPTRRISPMRCPPSPDPPQRWLPALLLGGGPRPSSTMAELL
jgi:hypothetical protein